MPTGGRIAASANLSFVLAAPQLEHERGRRRHRVEAVERSSRASTGRPSHRDEEVAGERSRRAPPASRRPPGRRARRAPPGSPRAARARGRSVTSRMPIQSGCSSPKRSRSSTTRCARSAGIAKPIPEAPWMIAVLMPITWPSRLTSGPPELPGLIEASVCRKSVKSARRRLRRAPRARAPRARRWSPCGESPNGLPIAITVSPISRSALLPSGVAGRPFASTLSTARSASRSAPSTVASSSRPSRVVTRIRDAPSMTCSLVTTMP